jgi:hypothetical protein
MDGNAFFQLHCPVSSLKLCLRKPSKPNLAARSRKSFSRCAGPRTLEDQRIIPQVQQRWIDLGTIGAAFFIGFLCRTLW